MFTPQNWTSFYGSSSVPIHDHQSNIYLIITVILVLRSIPKVTVETHTQMKSASGLTPSRWRCQEKGPGQPKGLVYFSHWWCGGRKCLTCCQSGIVSACISGCGFTNTCLHIYTHVCTDKELLGLNKHIAWCSHFFICLVATTMSSKPHFHSSASHI